MRIDVPTNHIHFSRPLKLVAREFLSKLDDVNRTQIYAKIENIEGLTHFDEILQEADDIIFSRGNLGTDISHEKVRAAIKVKASFIISFTSTGKAARYSCYFYFIYPIFRVFCCQ